MSVLFVRFNYSNYFCHIKGTSQSPKFVRWSFWDLYDPFISVKLNYTPTSCDHVGGHHVYDFNLTYFNIVVFHIIKNILL